MFHCGKRIIEVVQKPFPFFILRRLAETNRVVLKFLPMHQQDIFGRGFKAALQLVPGVSGYGGNDGLGLREGALESEALSRPHLQLCQFKNHFDSFPVFWSSAPQVSPTRPPLQSRNAPRPRSRTTHKAIPPPASQQSPRCGSPLRRWLART